MISVIIPLYNKEAIVERSIRSVLNQSYRDFELIIVDDGSTDGSADVVYNIVDERIVFIQQENGGPSKARNTGAKYARGEWIVFIDADDEMEDGALQTFSDYRFKYPNAGMFVGQVMWKCGDLVTKWNYKERVVKNVFRASVFDEFNPCSGTVMYAKWLIEMCPYNEQIRRFEDLECLYRKYHKTNVILIPHTVSIINTEYAAASRGRKDINEDFLGHLNLKGKGFWETLAYYKVFHQEHVLYEEQCRKLYPYLYCRYDLKVVTMLIGWLSSKMKSRVHVTIPENHNI